MHQLQADVKNLKTGHTYMTSYEGKHESDRSCERHKNGEMLFTILHIQRCRNKNDVIVSAHFIGAVTEPIRIFFPLFNCSGGGSVTPPPPHLPSPF